jgi:hypothetical protein
MTRVLLTRRRVERSDTVPSSRTKWWNRIVAATWSGRKAGERKSVPWRFV